MSSAFIDITGDQGRIYIFDKETLRDTVTFGLGEDLSFHAGDIPGNIVETVLSLPLDMLNFRLLELPIEDMEKIRQILPFELEGLMMGEPDSFVMDAVRIDSGKVLAVYVKKTKIRKLLDGLSTLGLDPREVTSLDLACLLESSNAADSIPGLLAGGWQAGAEERPEKATGQLKGSVINLRRGELSYTGESDKAKKSLRIASALFVLLALLISGNLAIKIVKARKDVVRLESAISRIYTSMFPNEKAAGAQGITYKMESHLKEIRTRELALRGVDSLEFLKLVQNAMPEGVIMKDITLDRGNITMKGEASSLSVIQAFKTRLDGVLDSVNISDTGKAASDMTVFTITARERQS